MYPCHLQGMWFRFQKMSFLCMIVVMGKTDNATYLIKQIKSREVENADT